MSSFLSISPENEFIQRKSEAIFFLFLSPSLVLLDFGRGRGDSKPL